MSAYEDRGGGNVLYTADGESLTHAPSDAQEQPTSTQVFDKQSGTT